MSDPYSAFRPPTANNNILQDGESRWWGNNPVGEPYAGERVTTDNMMTSATVYACTKALAETIAGLPAITYELRDGRREERNGDAIDLLAQEPNPEMDSFTFWEMAIARVTNRGNFFAEIQRDGNGRPIALWPIHNSRVEPVRDEGGELLWMIHHDYTGNAEYQDPTWKSRHLSFLTPRNMLNIVGFNSYNGIIATGVLPAENEVSIDFATQRYGGSFFAKGASLTGIVEHPSFIDDPTRRNVFRQDLNNWHSSRENPHKIGVLWQGATYKAVSVAPDQAQFLETRKFTSQNICKFYGTPPGIIGDFEHSKYSTADATIRQWVMTTLRNLAVRIEKAINRQVLSVRDSGTGKLKRAFEKPMVLELCLEGLLRGDPKTQAETFQIMRQNGVIDTDEWREAAGYNPIGGEGGKARIVPGGYTRIEDLGKQFETKNAQPAQDQVNPAAKRAAAKAKDNIARMLRHELKSLRRTRVQVQGADRKALLRETLRDVCSEAIDRIHGIMVKQVSERWGETDPKTIASKLPEFLQKQTSRLSEALAPADRIAERMGLEGKVSGMLTSHYIANVSKLDVLDLFDREKLDAAKNFDPMEVIE